MAQFRTSRLASAETKRWRLFGMLPRRPASAASTVSSAHAPGMTRAGFQEAQSIELDRPSAEAAAMASITPIQAR
jgi:hypothetical protein